ncbi:MAG TPA: LysR family transcriptional regulator [Pseudonocardiaceae bacterium]
MLDVRRLRVLRAVVESGSMAAAADELGYTPSAVSQHLAALEREAGSALLVRAGRGVRPTAAGALLAEHATAVLARLAEAEAALADLVAGRIGRLGVTFFPTAGASLVPPAVAAFRNRHPGVELRLEMAEPSVAVPAVAGGHTDLAVVVDMERTRPPDGLSWVHLLDDSYHVVLPRGHALARRRTLRLADIADEPWVQTASVPGPCQNVIMGACERAGFRPRVALDADDYPTTQGLVAAGVGVALVPGLALGAVHPAVVVRPIREHRPVRHIHAVVRDAGTLHPTVRTFLDALLDAARAHRDPFVTGAPALSAARAGLRA